MMGGGIIRGEGSQNVEWVAETWLDGVKKHGNVTKCPKTWERERGRACVLFHVWQLKTDSNG